MEKIEIWKDVTGYEGLYQVSSFGRVKSFNKRSKSKDGIIKGYLNRYGYEKICLYKNSTRKYTTIHQLVARDFIPNPNNYSQVNHKNGIKIDNQVENLEWCTPKQNTQHGIKIGLIKTHCGETNRLSKLTTQQVLEIRSKYVPRKYTCYKLAKEYNVTHRTILNLIHRVAWRHI